ncbi:MAG TPA: hypothetical protein VHE13_12060 [Opitutus sp.]|nr:hypothetical protein [Opitutus sp.]
MKALKAIAAGLLAVFLVGSASAQSTTVHITGSTAFRKATVIAIKNILQTGYTYGYIGSNAEGASRSVFSGTTKTTNLPVVIVCSWAGSTGGVQTVAQEDTINVATWLSATGNALTTGGTAISSDAAVYDAASPADVAMSDSFQASSVAYGTGYTTLTDTVVGVVTFVWTKGKSSDSGVAASLDNVTNITPLQAKLLLAAGLPMSMLTGNAADSDYYVYPMGRDEDSGTRLSELSEAQFGVFNSPIQYQPTIASGEITAIAPWPAVTILGFNYPEGHSGYASGGTLGTDLNNPVAASATDSFGSKFALIAYFGVNDATKVNNGNNNLMFNGVAYSDDAVREGTYACWEYEHLMYRPTLSGNTKTVADQIADQIINVDATQSGVLLSTMNVSKAVEGGVISHN